MNGCGDATAEAGKGIVDIVAAGCAGTAEVVAVALSFLTAELIGDSVKICTPDIAVGMVIVGILKCWSSLESQGQPIEPNKLGSGPNPTCKLSSSTR